MGNKTRFGDTHLSGLIKMVNFVILQMMPLYLALVVLPCCQIVSKYQIRVVTSQLNPYLKVIFAIIA